jgi:hypothetical protein
LQGAVPVIEGRGVVRHHRFQATPCAGGQLVVGDLFVV